MSLYTQLQRSSEQNVYDTQTITALVLVIKRTNSEQAQQKLKHRLFLGLGKLFIKAINNFNKLTKDVPKHKILHTPDDIALECYITFDTCIKNLKLAQIKKFYFFLNTSLNRAVYRLYEKQYKRYFNVIDNNNGSGSGEEGTHKDPLENAGYNQHFDFTEIDLFDFNEIELEILRFKIEGGKLNVFLKEHDMAGVMFYQIFEELKQKLMVRYKEESYFINFEMEEK